MDDIEQSEKRITDLIEASVRQDGSFYRDILDVLRGRREQVESLRQQHEGAVGELRRLGEEVLAALDAQKTPEGMNAATLLGDALRQRAEAMLSEEGDDHDAQQDERAWTAGRWDA